MPYSLYRNFRNYSSCAALAEVDSRSHRSAESQEHKPWARPRSRPGLQWAKPVSDPDQTRRVRPELSQSTVLRGELATGLLQVEVFSKILATNLVSYLVFSWYCKTSCQTFSVACESRQFQNPEFI